MKCRDCGRAGAIPRRSGGPPLCLFCAEARDEIEALSRWGVAHVGEGRAEDPGGSVVSAVVVSLAALAAMAAWIASCAL